MSALIKTVTFAGVLASSLCSATALDVAPAPAMERAAAVAWSTSPTDLFMAASDEATELASVRQDVSELVLNKNAAVVWFSVNELATRDFTSAVGAYSNSSSNGAWTPFIRSSMLTHNSQSWSNVQTSEQEEQSINHQFTICAGTPDDVECLSPEQLGIAIEALMPLTKNVDVHFLGNDLKSMESAAVIDFAISTVSAVFENAKQTLVVVLTGEDMPMARQLSGGECATTILLANEAAWAEAERREMQAVVIVLLVSSSPAILSGLLLSLFLVFTVGLYFCVLGDIRGQTEFVASYPYKGQQYD